MSKFDVIKARAEADWFLEYPDELDARTKRFAMMMRAACNEISALRSQNTKLQAVVDTAKLLRQSQVLTEAPFFSYSEAVLNFDKAVQDLEETK